ncbi:hypothetical protein O181_079782 [Austropuccinia psidii MF-1]|uniref:Uncharacterized protein n=1 Tax=Austropuccinia psidii MF-1 TaxID=1389203 RepID=A0A9Q3FKD8_9BASI|nr:hypothetical protein [Austropuccinia psidii MF-1]
MPKPLAGGHELLLTTQEFSGSGEDHRALRRVNPIVLQRQGQEDKELFEEPKSFIHIPEEGMEMTPALEKEGPVASTSPRSVQRQAKRTSEEAERSQEPSRKGKGQSPLAHTLPTGVQESPNQSLQQRTVSSIWPGLLWNSQPRSRKG